ncbi:MAG: hypothetical protein ACP5VE_15120 [Chthonomonadales bacterium]
MVGRVVDPDHGPLVRVVGREWRSSPAPTNLWLAEQKGCLPVRVERYLAAGQEPYEVMETTAVAKVGLVWMPVAARRVAKVPTGSEDTVLAATDVHIANVPDTLFVPAWSGRGEVWDSTTHTALRISTGGRLALDPRSPPVAGWADRRMQVRVAVATGAFVQLGAIVVGAVGALRRRACGY